MVGVTGSFHGNRHICTEKKYCRPQYELHTNLSKSMIFHQDKKLRSSINPLLATMKDLPTLKHMEKPWKLLNISLTCGVIYPRRPLSKQKFSIVMSCTVTSFSFCVTESSIPTNSWKRQRSIKMFILPLHRNEAWVTSRCHLKTMKKFLQSCLRKILNGKIAAPTPVYSWRPTQL